MTEATVPEPFTNYRIELGYDRGQALVTVFDSGEVRADWRSGDGEVWRPVEIAGGSVSTERVP